MVVHKRLAIIFFTIMAIFLFIPTKTTKASSTVALYYVNINNSNTDTIITMENTNGINLPQRGEATLHDIVDENTKIVIKKFDGWYTDADFQNLYTSKTISVDSDITELYAKWVDVHYVYLNTGTNIYNIEMTYNDNLILPTLDKNNNYIDGSLNNDSLNNKLHYNISIPSQNGYYFNSWYGNNKSYTKIDKLSSNITLNIKYEPISYNITYNLNGGNFKVSSPSTYTIKDEFTFSIPEKIGYKFIKWIYNDNKSIESIKKGTTGDITLSAVWEETTFNINYELNEEDTKLFKDLLTKTSYSYTESYTLPTLTKEGYTFEGWYNENDKKITNTKGIYKDITIHPKWTPNTYTITYVIDSDTTIDNKIETYTYNTEVELPKAIKEGYEFNGWLNSKNEVITKIEKGTIGNLKLSPFWKINTYKVTYHLNEDETINSETTIEKTYNVSIQLATPIKYGYTFIGWQYREDLSDKAITLLKDNLTSDIILYPEWKAKVFEYTIDYNGGTGRIAKTSISFNDKLSFIDTLNAQKTGNNIIGYTLLVDNQEISVNSDSIVTIEGNATLKLLWETSSFILKFEAMNGTCEEKERIVQYGSPIGDLPIATREGYKFIGWYYNNNYVTNTQMTISNNTTFYARYSSSSDTPSSEISSEKPSENAEYTDTTNITNNITTKDTTNPWYIAPSTGYYYDTLNSDEQIIYKALYDYYSNGEHFNESLFLTINSTLDESTFGNELVNSSTAFLYDHVEITWINYFSIHLTTENGTYKVELEPIPLYDYNELYKAQQMIAISNSYATLLNKTNIKDTDTTSQKIMKIENAICNTLKYGDPNTLGDYPNQLRDPAYSVFCNYGESGVCVAYAKLFKIICNYYNLNSVYITGKLLDNSENHVWNYVQIDNDWYFMDITNDDSLEDYTYFLLGNTNKISNYLVNNTFNLDINLSNTDFIQLYSKNNVLYEIPEIWENFAIVTDIYNNNIVIPNKIKCGSISYKVVQIENCPTNLKKITLGKNIKKVKNSLFKNCNNLKCITIKSTKTNLKTSNFNKKQKLDIKVPKKLVKKFTKRFKNFKNITIIKK